MREWRKSWYGSTTGSGGWVGPARLGARAEGARLAFEQRAGTPLGYFARFSRSATPAAPTTT